MSCCGKNRAHASTERQISSPLSTSPTSSANVQQRRAPGLALHFQYVGATGLTVRGPITGRSYRFSRNGETVAVDERDAPSLRAVPNLQPVK